MSEHVFITFLENAGPLPQADYIAKDSGYVCGDEFSGFEADEADFSVIQKKTS